MSDFRFAESTRDALLLARDEANRLRHDYIGTEHMLLGLLAQGEPAAALLRAAGTASGEVRVHLDKALMPGNSTRDPRRGELPYTSLAKKALESAFAEAKAADEREVTPAHLLVGVMQEAKGIAGMVLRACGASLEQLRHAARAGPTSSRTFRVVIDDASDASIYEQIMARVQEGIATGELEPGERLPPVRALADELDIAPGTVARAYAELERQGVLVTDGARGTRVADRRPAPAARPVDPAILAGLLRPVAVAAFHMGAGAAQLRLALEEAMRGIFDSTTSPGTDAT